MYKTAGAFFHCDFEIIQTVDITAMSGAMIRFCPMYHLGESS